MRQFKINIDFVGTPEESLITVTREAAQEVFLHEKVDEDSSINVFIADDEYLQQLNQQYRGYDQPTDVLAFPMEEEVDGLKGHLGDIAISMNAVSRQALEAGHSDSAEIQLLVVHGFLHLLGYDHGTEIERKQMWTAQNSIINQLN